MLKKKLYFVIPGHPSHIITINKLLDKRHIISPHKTNIIKQWKSLLLSTMSKIHNIFLFTGIWFLHFLHLYIDIYIEIYWFTKILDYHNTIFYLADIYRKGRNSYQVLLFKLLCFERVVKERNSAIIVILSGSMSPPYITVHVTISFHNQNIVFFMWFLEIRPVWRKRPNLI